jgi:hypothetical protein
MMGYNVEGNLFGNDLDSILEELPEGLQYILGRPPTTRI